MSAGGWPPSSGGFLIDTAAAILPTTYTRMVKLIADAGLAGEVVADLGPRRDRPRRVVHHMRSSKAPLDGLKTGLLSPAAKLQLVKVITDLAPGRGPARLVRPRPGRRPRHRDGPAVGRPAALARRCSTRSSTPPSARCSSPPRTGCRRSTSSSPSATSSAARSSTRRRAWASSPTASPATSTSNSTPAARRSRRRQAA